MDILITIALVYFAYRGYSWYTSMQKQVKGGDNIREVSEEDIDAAPAPGREDDYIDYEEIK